MKQIDFVLALILFCLVSHPALAAGDAPELPVEKAGAISADNFSAAVPELRDAAFVSSRNEAARFRISSLFSSDPRSGMQRSLEVSTRSAAPVSSSKDSDAGSRSLGLSALFPEDAQRSPLFASDDANRLLLPGVSDDEKKLWRDSLNPRNSYWIPLAQGIGLNLALGAFNAYVMNSEYAKISFQTIKDNFEHGWGWDADNLVTNMFSHPFHGSIYYNMARSNGYNYWASMSVAAISSWQWEFFMENEPPAINDWIMTSIAGSMYGEMFYRLSNLILDESTTGAERVWREIGAGVFNPGRLFNRLIYGRTSRVVNEQIYEVQPFTGEMALGMNNVADGLSFKNGEKNLMFTLDVMYGNPFSRKQYKPFDTFHFYTAVNFWNQPVLGRFDIDGLLYGKTHKIGENGDKLLLGFSQYATYMHNNVYEIGGVAVGGVVGYKTPDEKPVEFMTSVHAAFMPMGAANSEYAEYFPDETLDSARTYNMGPGALGKINMQLKFSFVTLVLRYGFWWVHSLSGAPGDEYIGILEPKVYFDVYDRWVIGLQYLLYHRKGKYENEAGEDASLSSQNNEQRLFLAYRF